MIIVRYWSVKRLNRLWELVENEKLEAENDQTNQQINSHYLFTNGIAPTSATRLTKLPVPSLGDSDAGLCAMENTPKDMVQLSERVLTKLLANWVIDRGSSNSSFSDDPRAPYIPQVHFSSDSDENASFDGHNNAIRGYYLEGTTDDWRKPHSQEARYHRARLREKYAGYQPHVDSDPEEDRVSKPRRESPRASGDVFDFADDLDTKWHSPQKSHRNGPTMSHIPSQRRNSPGAYDSRPPTFNAPSSAHSTSNLRPPGQYHHSSPRPVQQQSFNQIQDHHMSRSMPEKFPSPGGPRSGPAGQSEPRKPNTVRFSSPQPQQRHSPTPLYSSDSNRSHQQLSYRQKSSRDDGKGRHKSFTQSASKGLIGAGAIAGFMDALEAFSAI